MALVHSATIYPVSLDSKELDISYIIPKCLLQLFGYTSSVLDVLYVLRIPVLEGKP